MYDCEFDAFESLHEVKQTELMEAVTEYVTTQVKEAAYVIENWDEFTTIVKGVVDGVRNALADSFQGFADALRTGGREE